MKDVVRIVEEISDLEQIIWEFRFIYTFGKGVFALRRWAHEKRETRRHKFRCSQSDGTLWIGGPVVDRRWRGAAMPEIPDHVAEMARKEFADSIEISREKE